MSPKHYIHIYRNIYRDSQHQKTMAIGSPSHWRGYAFYQVLFNENYKLQLLQTNRYHYPPPKRLKLACAQNPFHIFSTGLHLTSSLNRLSLLPSVGR